MSPVSSNLSPPEMLDHGGRWYFSRKEIEENSPSKRDGIGLKKETYLRKAYSTFLQDLGIKLNVPQVTIASAIIFCHRFYLRQSHSKNDRRTISTACMFLAAKVAETPRPLKDVILVSYEIISKNDPVAIQKIKQKEVYEQQKELILLAERVVLATLGFDLNVQHPYTPLVKATKKFNVAQTTLSKYAWNFVNDGLRTSLSLQFKAHHIAASAIFLAAKFLKVKLPSDGDKVWWQEFDVTPCQLEEVNNQVLELYEQNRVPASQTSGADGSTVGGDTDKGTSKGSNEDQVGHANPSLVGVSSRSGALKSISTHLGPEPVDNYNGLPKSTQNCSSDYGSSMTDTQSNKEHEECRASGPSSNHMSGSSDRHDGKDDKEGEFTSINAREGMDVKESVTVQSKPEVIKRFDEDKLKQLREKRKRYRDDAVRRTDSDMMDDFDPIMKELEEGVELAAAESEKSKQEKKQSWSQPSSLSGNENSHHIKHADAVGDQHELETKGQGSAFENPDLGNQSPKSTDRKRKAGSPLEKTSERHDHKRHAQENHV